ncbi:MAG: hypothetical protein M3237_06590 [Actinomycetota bacterium]|nr:hypothetical protein [Actinomycetota bacterium]
MTTQVSAPRQAGALVPEELRGYRQFELRADGLYPLVHLGSGPWAGGLERARCGVGAEHPPPGADCRCGLYGWYLPGTATVLLGPANAVIAARGRCVLGDRGFRAAAARIEAVALPAVVRWNPWQASKARQMLAQRYPRTRVYRSPRQMLKDHPPHDVRALGIDPPDDRSHQYRAAAAATYATGMILTPVLAALPLVVAAGFEKWLLLVVFFFVLAWQAGLVWLLAQLARLQGLASADGGGHV